MSAEVRKGILGIVGFAYQPLTIAGCVLLAAVSGCLLLRQLRLAREIRHLAAHLGAASVAANRSPLAQLRAAAKAVEERWGALNERHDQRHSTTGLPTRERLLARMAEDGLGTLGVIAFVDFDRLCAFDPDLADRALMLFAARIVRMIGSERIFAHVDRSHFAIWFGSDVPDAEAEAQLVAISYALSNVLSDEGFEIVPEARVHHAAFSA